MSIANTILGCDDAEMPKKKPWNKTFQGFQDDRYAWLKATCVIVFFHPDCNRWPWIRTRSALLLQGSRALRCQLSKLTCVTASEEFRLALKTVFKFLRKLL